MTTASAPGSDTTRPTSPTGEPSSLGDALGPIRERLCRPDTPEERERRAAREAIRERQRIAQERGEREERWRRMQRRIGSRYAECTLRNFAIRDPRQKAIVDKIAEFGGGLVERVAEGANLLLIGPPGTGKDHLVVSLMRLAILTHGMSVEWVNGMDWFGRVRDSMDSGESEKQVLDELVRPDILVLSDPVPPLGDLTDFQRIMLYRAIDGRYRNRRPTWITANMETREEADARLGAQTHDRLCDGGIVLWCSWPSHRQLREAVGFSRN